MPIQVSFCSEPLDVIFAFSGCTFMMLRTDSDPFSTASVLSKEILVSLLYFCGSRTPTFCCDCQNYRLSRVPGYYLHRWTDLVTDLQSLVVHSILATVVVLARSPRAEMDTDSLLLESAEVSVRWRGGRMNRRPEDYSSVRYDCWLLWCPGCWHFLILIFAILGSPMGLDHHARDSRCPKASMIAGRKDCVEEEL